MVQEHKMYSTVNTTYNDLKQKQRFVIKKITMS